jgi:hypothetical protein
MLIRHPDQTALPPGFEEIEPPPYFAEAAYSMGVERGSGTIRLVQGGGSVTALLDAKVRGVLIHLRVLGATNDEATRALLRAIGRLT